MKKYVALFLCVFLLFSFVGCTTDEPSNSNGNEETNKTSDPKNFEYEEIAGGLEITNYVGNEKKIVVPSVIGNKKVVSISREAFSGNVLVEEITLPESITGEIFFTIFANCDSLKKVVFLGNITEIEDVVFEVPALETVVFKSLDEGALRDINNVLEGCEQLKNIVIENIPEFTKASIGGWPNEGRPLIQKPVNYTIPENVETEILKMEALTYENESEYVYGFAHGWILKKEGTEVELSEQCKASLIYAFDLGEWTLLPDFKVMMYSRSIRLEGRMIIDGVEHQVEYYFGDNVEEFNLEDFDVEDVSADNLSFIEPLDSFVNMCIAFVAKDITVNGKQYKYDFS